MIVLNRSDLSRKSLTTLPNVLTYFRVATIPVIDAPDTALLRFFAESRFRGLLHRLAYRLPGRRPGSALEYGYLHWKAARPAGRQAPHHCRAHNADSKSSGMAGVPHHRA